VRRRPSNLQTEQIRSAGAASHDEPKGAIYLLITEGRWEGRLFLAVWEKMDFASSRLIIINASKRIRDHEGLYGMKLSRAI